ncbi:hypothetical protein [Nannocystis bainbridge]|uniref:Tetratricopeptide repeat protein n=1 Tax=Nannocystis bainbridge TaxID=2995303 RepID=A0ABT5ECI8_9BACT|nr:hypothetical protein [Nannocystis bainbridge]MDC0723039.1 hypothetical protein [Nannocystis bainbridge]
MPPRRVVVFAPEPAHTAVFDAAWRAGHVPCDISEETEDAETALVVRIGNDPGPADLRLPEGANIGPAAYAELRLLGLPAESSEDADVDDVGDVDEDAGDEDDDDDGNDDVEDDDEDEDEDDAAKGDATTTALDAHLPAPPPLPAPYLVHPYFQSRVFTGRTADLAELDLWLAHGQPARVLVALGGVGKSALAWAWLQRRLVDAPWAGCLWWSFYEGGADFDALIRHLAIYATGMAPLDALRADRPALEQRILAALQARPFLLVLDGLERALVAYHRLDAARLPDDVADAALDLHACTDPRDGRFLRALVQASPSRLLATSRIFPSDLRDGEALVPGVELSAAQGLDPADIPGLLRAHGLDPEAWWVDSTTQTMAKLGHSSLLWRLLAGCMHDYARPTTISGRAHEAPAVLRAHILDTAFELLPARAARLLSRIAALRAPVGIDTVLALADPPPLGLRRPPPQPLAPLRQLERALADETSPGTLTYLQDRHDELRARRDAWDVYHALAGTYARLPGVLAHYAGVHADLCLLEARGFLHWDRGSNRHDLHPVIRAHAFERLAGPDRTAAFEAIRDHFEQLPPEPKASVRSLADLQRTIEIYSALIGAGDFYAAFELYYDRLSAPLDERLSAFATIVELLTPLFTRGLREPPALSDPWGQSVAITLLSNALALVGRDRDAEALRELSIRINLRRRNPDAVVVSLVNWALSIEAEDHTHAALRTFDLAHRLAVAAGGKQALPLRHRARLAIELGRWHDAEADLAAIDDGELDTNDRLTLTRNRIELAIYRGDDPAPWLAAAWRELERTPRVFDTAQLHALLARIAMAAGAYADAEPHLNEALRLARRMGATHAGYRARLATCLAHLGRPAEARRFLADAHDAADRPLAEAHLALGEPDLARPLALEAYREAWADGPPFAWFDELRLCTRLLAALGLPPPELPPFDPSRSPQIACEAEIEAFIADLAAKRPDA